MNLLPLYTQTEKGTKMLLCAAAILATVLIAGSKAEAAYDPNTDYMMNMIAACCANDAVSGRQAEACRNEKIADMGYAIPTVSYNDLRLLSKIMQAEAGSEWLSDDWKMAVGEVVLNRVASPEFPNTLAGVLAQPGQYYGANSSYFNSLNPSYKCVALAARLLMGERVLNNPAVVFQANFRQGSGVHMTMYDKYLGYTYFCYSNHPSLYK